MGRTKYLVFWIPLLFGGCQTIQLNRSTERQAGSITDVYYVQILNNIASISADPDKLPYFSVPTAGQTSTQFSVNTNYTVNLDLLTAISTLGTYLGKYVIDKQSGFITGGDANIEQWNTKPTYDPNQLLLMKYAYEVLFGNRTHYDELASVLKVSQEPAEKKRLTEEEQKKVIAEIIGELEGFKGEKRIRELESMLGQSGFGTRWDLPLKEIVSTFKLNDTEKTLMAQWLQDQRDIRIQRQALKEEYDRLNPQERFRPDFTQYLRTGWFETGRRCDVPKHACYVGRCGKTYAWVIPGQEAALADFALVILDITTYQRPNRIQPAPNSPAMGRSSTR